MNSDIKPEKIELIAIASDGGTKAINVTIESKEYNLFIDNRIGTSTANEIFTAHPDNEEANMVSPKSLLAMAIKNENF